MKKLILGLLIFVILFFLFPKVVGSLVLLTIVGVVLREFVIEGIQS